MPTKAWWKSKTLWLNTSTILLGVLLLLKDRPWMPPAGTEVCLILDGIANIILRVLRAQDLTLTTAPGESILPRARRSEK